MKTFLLLTILLMLACPPPASAYIDPSAGAVYMQLFYAGWLLVACMAVKLQRQVSAFVRAAVNHFRRTRLQR